MGLLDSLLGEKCANCGKRLREPLAQIGYLRVCPDCLKVLEEEKKRFREEEERWKREAQESARKRGEEIKRRKEQIHREKAEINLIAAIQAGRADAVRRLVENGAGVNEADWNGKTPLGVAAYGDSIEILEILLNAGADVQAANKRGWTPLHFAAAAGRLENVRRLVSRGADAAALDSEGRSAASIAGEKDFGEIAAFLTSLTLTVAP